MYVHLMNHDIIVVAAVDFSFLLLASQNVHVLSTIPTCDYKSMEVFRINIFVFAFNLKIRTLNCFHHVFIDSFFLSVR